VLDISKEDEEKLVLGLMKSLDMDKADGEKTADFEKRVFSEVSSYLNITGLF